MSDTDPNHQAAWYCVRSQPKHEHIAAANLRSRIGIEVFSPSLRVRRSRPAGAIWVREPLFPGYLFARFPFQTGFDPVRHTSGVKALVQFGGEFPPIPDETIEEIRASLGGDETIEHLGQFAPGDTVEVLDGPFRGLTAVVHRYVPAAQRVHLLLEFLGQLTPVQLSATSLQGSRRYPEHLLHEAN